MGKLEESLNFLKSDLDKAKQQWEGSEQMQSLLQREDKNIDDLWSLFDPSEDENAWVSEYNSGGNTPILIQRRKRLSFLKASRKEFKEEYDPKYTDCDYMRLLELPYTEPKFTIEFGLEDMKKV